MNPSSHDILKTSENTNNPINVTPIEEELNNNHLTETPNSTNNKTSSTSFTEKEFFLNNLLCKEALVDFLDCGKAIPMFCLKSEFNIFNSLNTFKNRVCLLTIVLNNRSVLSKENCKEFINSSNVVLSADGASNLLKDYEAKINYALGDLDSILEETISYLQKHNIAIEKSYCQDTTDMEKCCKKVLSWLEAKDENKESLVPMQLVDFQENLINIISIIGCSGGRMDHTFSNLSIFCRYSKLFFKHDFHCLSLSEKAMTYCMVSDKISFIYCNMLVDGEDPNKELKQTYSKCFIVILIYIYIYNYIYNALSSRGLLLIH